MVDPAPDDDEAPDLDDLASQGLAHLQAAAREMIAATRALIDVAEGLVEDPKAVSAMFEAVSSVVRGAARAATAKAPPDDDDGYERIKVR